MEQITRSIHAKKRIAIKDALCNISANEAQEYEMYYSQILNAPGDNKHELDYYSYMLDQLNIKHSTNELHPKLPIPDINDKLELPEKYVAIVPGSSLARKNWPVTHFAEVALTINLPIVILGSSDDKDVCNRLEVLIRQHSEKVINTAGIISLSEFVRFITNSDLVISNDTAAVHISIAANRPCICILGGWHFGHFAPYPDYIQHKATFIFERMDCFNCNWQCKYVKDSEQLVPCVKKINTFAVKKAIIGHIGPALCI